MHLENKRFHALDDEVLKLFLCEFHFCPRDAMLARVLVLAMALCLSVSVSVTSRCSIETDERIGLVFDTGTSFDLSYTVL